MHWVLSAERGFQIQEPVQMQAEVSKMMLAQQLLLVSASLRQWISNLNGRVHDQATHLSRLFPHIQTYQGRYYRLFRHLHPALKLCPEGDVVFRRGNFDGKIALGFHGTTSSPEHRDCRVALDIDQ